MISEGICKKGSENNGYRKSRHRSKRTEKIADQIGTEATIKKTLFLQAKKRLKEFLASEGLKDEMMEELICEGIPFLEINKKAIETGADMVIMGNRGTSGDMQTIFFGSTAERVLRFMKRPVLCVSIEENREK